MKPFQSKLDEALAAVQKPSLDGLPAEKLKEMLNTLRTWHLSQDAREALPAIDAIEHALARLQQAQHHETETTVQQQGIDQDWRSNQDLVGELVNIKSAIKRLEKARPIDWLILAAGVVAAIAGVWALLR